MTHPTFAERYCELNGIAPAQFADSVLRRALYPQARLLLPLVQVLAPNYFAADFDLIGATARLRRTRDFASEADQFNYHPANIGFLRRTLRIRLSTTRLKQLLRTTLGRSTPGADSDPDA
jgi:hypothetical protein